MAVLPGHLLGARSGFTDNGAMSNVRLRVGEVQAIYFPSDERNVSGRFVEYDVWVQHRANGTAVTKTYNNVIAIDHFGSKADFSFATYRVKQNNSNEGDQKEAAPGKGSKVILLCINGETNNAIILGGLRDFNSTKDTKDDGHNMHSVFNGVDVTINKDGEFQLVYNGATDLDGQPAENTDKDSSGTYVKIDKSGNVTISDKDGSNAIVVSHSDGKVNVTGANEINLIAPTVRAGDDSTADPMVGGNELVEIMQALLTAIEAITVLTIVGPSTPPVNNLAFEAIRGQLNTLLSTNSFVKM